MSGECQNRDQKISSKGKEEATSQHGFKLLIALQVSSFHDFYFLSV
jgi:hypothetical protein